MKLKSTWMTVLSLSAFATHGLVTPVAANPLKQKKIQNAPESVEGELIVRLRDSSKSAHSVASAQARIQAILSSRLGIKSVAEVKALQMDEKIQKVTLATKSDASAAIAALRESGEVKYAEPNFIYHTQLETPVAALVDPSDIDFSKQWDMKNTGQADKDGQLGKVGSDVNVAPAWEKGITGDRRVVVAVIDTGVDYMHGDLAANIYVNAREVAGNGIDDDGNGVVDDVHGASFTTSTGTNRSLDDNNHGTHCAGTIGAVGNNGIGLSGMNWEVSILPVKFLTASGSGSLDGAINSIKYATKMGVNIMSNSWGGGGYSEALKEAIQEANDAGILFVAAAGNNASNNDSIATYPANYAVPNVVSVAATDNRDVIASFSNYGKTMVHTAAPGKNILSTLKGNAYGIFSGTSMACPHVAGAAALLWSRYPDLNADEVKARLIQTSTPVQGLKNRVAAKGRINVMNMIDNVIAPPQGPSDSAWETVSYSVESEHPYAARANQTFSVSVPGAKYIRIIFDRVETENGYDTVSVENAKGEAVETLSGVRTAYTSEYVEGDLATIRLKSDESQQKYGFKVSTIQIVR